MSVGLLQTIPDSIKVAREYAVLGQYETATAYYDGSLASVSQYETDQYYNRLSYLRTVKDRHEKDRWERLKDNLTAEVQIIQDMMREIQTLKERAEEESKPGQFRRKFEIDRDPLVWTPSIQENSGPLNSIEQPRDYGYAAQRIQQRRPKPATAVKTSSPVPKQDAPRIVPKKTAVPPSARNQRKTSPPRSERSNSKSKKPEPIDILAGTPAADEASEAGDVKETPLQPK